MAQCDRGTPKSQCKTKKASCDKGTSCKGLKKQEMQNKDKCVRTGCDKKQK